VAAAAGRENGGTTMRAPTEKWRGMNARPGFTGPDNLADFQTGGM